MFPIITLKAAKVNKYRYRILSFPKIKYGVVRATAAAVEIA